MSRGNFSERGGPHQLVKLMNSGNEESRNRESCETSPKNPVIIEKVKKIGKKEVSKASERSAWAKTSRFAQRIAFSRTETRDFHEEGSSRADPNGTGERGGPKGERTRNFS